MGDVTLTQAVKDCEIVQPASSIASMSRDTDIRSSEGRESFTNDPIFCNEMNIYESEVQTNRIGSLNSTALAPQAVENNRASSAKQFGWPTEGQPTEDVDSEDRSAPSNNDGSIETEAVLSSGAKQSDSEDIFEICNDIFDGFLGLDSLQNVGVEKAKVSEMTSNHSVCSSMSVLADSEAVHLCDKTNVAKSESASDMHIIDAEDSHNIETTQVVLETGAEMPVGESKKDNEERLAEVFEDETIYKDHQVLESIYEEKERSQSSIPSDMTISTQEIRTYTNVGKDGTDISVSNGAKEVRGDSSKSNLKLCAPMTNDSSNPTRIGTLNDDGTNEHELAMRCERDVDKANCEQRHELINAPDQTQTGTSDQTLTEPATTATTEPSNVKKIKEQLKNNNSLQLAFTRSFHKDNTTGKPTPKNMLGLSKSNKYEYVHPETTQDDRLNDKMKVCFDEIKRKLCGRGADDVEFPLPLQEKCQEERDDVGDGIGTCDSKTANDVSPQMSNGTQMRTAQSGSVSISDGVSNDIKESTGDSPDKTIGKNPKKERRKGLAKLFRKSNKS